MTAPSDTPVSGACRVPATFTANTAVSIFVKYTRPSVSHWRIVQYTVTKFYLHTRIG
jgi:hypothetical protein